MARAVDYQIISDWQAAEGIWSELLSHAPDHSLFQEPSIQRAWWESHGRPALKLIVVRANRKVIALFPLCQNGERLQFLGDQAVSDLLDGVILPEYGDAAMEGLRQFLAKDTSWKSLALVSIPEHSVLLSSFEQLAKEKNGPYERVQQDVCPIIELPTSWEAYLTALGRKQRHEVQRKLRRLQELGDVTFRVVTDTRHDPESLDTFVQLHQRSSPEKAAFWTTTHREYFERIAQAASEHGWLRLYFLDLDGQPAATMLCFEYGDELLVYNSGYDATKYGGMSVGNVLTADTIEDAIKLGKKRYNFLRGNEEYKFRYGAQPHPIFNISVQRTM